MRAEVGRPNEPDRLVKDVVLAELDRRGQSEAFPQLAPEAQMTETEVAQMMAQASLIGCRPQPSNCGRYAIICGGGIETAELLR